MEPILETGDCSIINAYLRPVEYTKEILEDCKNKTREFMSYPSTEAGKDMIAYPTGSIRADKTGKGRYDLLPCHAIHRLTRHFEEGGKVHGARNWEKGQPLHQFVDSALRHIFQWLGGDRSEDHLAAAAWNIMALIETENRIDEGHLPRELNDLPHGTSYDR